VETIGKQYSGNLKERKKERKKKKKFNPRERKKKYILPFQPKYFLISKV
jgi:hypothetical protein